MEIKLNGVTFDNRQANINEVKVGETVFLVRQRNNQFDKYAVEIFTNYPKSLGFIPKEHSSTYAMLLDSGVLLRGRVKKIIGEVREHQGIIIEVFKG